jgi:hypothetical protein
MNFSAPASEHDLAVAVEALKQNGFDVFVVENGEEAKAKALELIPEGAEVMTMSSLTVDLIGLAKELNESGRYRPVREKFKTMDKTTQGRQMRALGATPEWSVGSVHAVTMDGHLLDASQSGSQLPAHVYGADRVLFVVGSQKIVKDTQEGIRRVYEHALPLENERAKKVYGSGSAVNNLLHMNATKPGRVTVILIRENIGF